jgi:hypothetical protein
VAKVGGRRNTPGRPDRADRLRQVVVASDQLVDGGVVCAVVHAGPNVLAANVAGCPVCASSSSPVSSTDSPRSGCRHRPAAGAGRVRSGLPLRPDVLWAAGIQRRVRRAGDRDGRAHRGGARRHVRADRGPVRLVRRHAHPPHSAACWPTARARQPPVGWRNGRWSCRVPRSTRVSTSRRPAGPPRRVPSFLSRVAQLGLEGVGERLLDAGGAERCDLQGADECCGFGGLFSIELPEVSSAMLDTKLAAIEESGAGWWWAGT